MRTLGQDFQYAFRMLLKSPGFASIAILSLALGIGANTAIFSLLDQLLLRALPVREPGRIVQLAARGSHHGNDWGMNMMSYPMYRDFRDQAEVFDGVIGRRAFHTNLGHDGTLERAVVELVTGNYFAVLGVPAALGRTLSPDDDRQVLGHPVVVLSYDYWRSRFGADPGILNRTVAINNAPFTVIGVAEAGFQGMEVGTASQMFAPMLMQERIVPGQKLLEERRTRFINVFARLKPGVAPESAKAAVQPLYHAIIEGEVREAAFARAATESKEAFLRSTMDVFPGGTGTGYLRLQLATPVYVLMGLVAFVLLIACANVANLQLARATARGKELAIRLAMGASRWRIVRQLLVESVVVALLAGAAGLLMGRWVLSGLLSLRPPDTSSLTIRAAIDPRMLAFNFGMAALVGVLFGLAPALQATRPDMAGTLKDQATAVAGGAHARFRKALLVVQVSLSLVLLIGAGLFVNSLRNLRKLHPGFQAENLLMFGVDPTSAGYDVARVKEFYRRLDERLAALPGVLSVGEASMALVGGDEWDSIITVEGHDRNTNSRAWTFMNLISPNYFGSLGARLVAGRDFRWDDSNPDRKVCIVNRRLVQEYFPKGDAVGRHIGMGGDPGTLTDIEIVGVVENFKYGNMSEQIGRQMYRPYRQMTRADGMYFYIRAARDPKALMGPVRAAVRALDPNLPIDGMRTLEAQIERNLVTQRLVAGLSAALGALATLLAVLGLYGVMAYLVGRRSREIGIRMALGAAPGEVIGMILGEVLTLVAMGVAIGLAGSFGLTRLVESQLFGISAMDWRVVAGGTLGLSSVAALAGFLPALRASRLDPLDVLRYE